MLICLIIICEQIQIVNIVSLIVKIQLIVSLNVQNISKCPETIILKSLNNLYLPVPISLSLLLYNVCSLSYLLIVKTLLCLILYTNI